MDDSAQMMRRNEPRERIERKQSDIYRRMLDVHRSRRQQGEKKERKSYTAKTNESHGAALPGDLGEKQEYLNERMKEALRDDYNEGYRELVRRYFESMLNDYESGETGGDDE